MTKCITEKCVQPLRHKACCIGLPYMHLTHAIHEEQILQYFVTGDETFVNHMALESSIVSLMWKQH
jgi:hypothetical protein